MYSNLNSDFDNTDSVYLDEGALIQGELLQMLHCLLVKEPDVDCVRVGPIPLLSRGVVAKPLYAS